MQNSNYAHVALMMLGWIVSLCSAIIAQQPSVSNRDLDPRLYNIRDYGAIGDGSTVDTAALQKAIDACARDNGGTVLVPAGVFVIGTTELKSNVTLKVAAGGKLLGSPRAADYHAAEDVPLRRELDVTLEDGNWALIYAVHANNITVEGPGTIDGGGPPPEGLGGRRRPYGLLLYRCKNVSVRDIEMVRCPYHMVRAIQSAYLKMDGIHIHSRVAGNNDGFHFISCEYVHIGNCDVQCGDDACALFGSCKYVTVNNSTFSTRWSVFRFGGGATENVAVSNCIFAHVYGCPIKFQGGRGDPDSRFKNISFSNILLDDVTGPISISISSPPGLSEAPEPAPMSEPAQPTQPVKREGVVTVRNITFSNIHGTVTTNPSQFPDFDREFSYRPAEKMSAIVLNCVGSAVMENISFSDINLTFGGGGTVEIAANRDVPEAAGEYFRLGPIPAYGMYARNVKGLTLRNVRFQLATPDLRPAIILDHVREAAIHGLSVQSNAKAESALRLINTQDALMTGVRLLTDASVLLRLEGSTTRNIRLYDGDWSKATQALICVEGAEPDAVTLRN